jgi:RNA polymerase sigma factor (sigma-70 family)
MRVVSPFQGLRDNHSIPPRAALRSALGYIVAAPSVLNANGQTRDSCWHWAILLPHLGYIVAAPSVLNANGQTRDSCWHCGLVCNRFLLFGTNELEPPPGTTMAKKSLNGVLQHVRLMAAVQTDRALSDPELLERFIGQNDEAAFTVLVERHGPMVLGVCHRALRHAQDAEDACQATFLVFARKAGSIRKTAALGSWLHGIACRICANLKRQQARRQKRERQAAKPSTQPDAGSANWRDVQTILDEEVQQLPERYRTPLLLCYWESKTRDEAAQLLGLSIGKLHGLLERGRALLRDRLTRRGLTLSAALCASFLTAGAASAALAPTLVVSCTKAALLLAAGEPLANGIVSTEVLVLTREVLKSMLFTKLKIATASILCAGLLATVIGGSLATIGSAQNTPDKVKVVVDPPPRAESDEAFIRRISKDLRSAEPSPAEVHFFVNNKDANRRQKLVDLFIQERQAKQSAETVGRINVWTLSQLDGGKKRILFSQHDADPRDKIKFNAKVVEPLEANRLQLEAELKQLEAELERVLAQGAVNEKIRDLTKARIEDRRRKLDLEQLQLRDLEKTKQKAKDAKDGAFWIDMSPSMRPSVLGLQNAFSRSLIGAAKEKKDISKITQAYLDSLMKYVQNQPKAGDVPDAMLQIELVYRALGKTVEANAWGDKLKTEHPNSPAANHRQNPIRYRMLVPPQSK